MTKESLTGIDKNLVFKETFNSEQATRRNGGVPTDVTYSNGVGTFNGSTSVIETNFNGTQFGELSFAFWAKTNDLAPGHDQFILDNTPGSVGFAIRQLSGTATMQTFVFRGGAQISTVTIPDTGWHFYVVTTNATSLNISIDGGAFVTETFASNPITKSGSLMVIGKPNDAGDNINWDGDINLVEIYNRILTINEAKNLYEDKYHKGIPIKTSAANQILNIDSSLGGLADRFGNTITNTDVTIVRDGDIYAQKYNATNSRLDLGTFNTLVGDKTFIAWVKANSKGEGSAGKIMDNGKFTFRVGGTDRILVSSDGSISAQSNDNAITLNEWILFVVTRTSAGLTTLYKNGILEGGMTNETSGTPVAGSTNIFIGNNNGTTATWDGLINAERIYDGILSTQEISQIYTSEKERYIK